MRGGKDREESRGEEGTMRCSKRSEYRGTNKGEEETTKTPRRIGE